MGMGTDDRAAACLGKVVDSGCPCVLDADALNLIAGMDVSFSGTAAVLTPHPGEAARLLNVKTADVQANRFEALDALVARYSAVVVLKGAGSLIGGPGQKTRLCSAGNPGMAVGGMGDVLSGVIGALMANGLSAFDAACAGVTVHSEAADLLVAEKGVLGLLPQDMGEAIRAVMNGRLGVKGV
jgi:NAD(P)H-hydrate epimerase